MQIIQFKPNDGWMFDRATLLPAGPMVTFPVTVPVTGSETAIGAILASASTGETKPSLKLATQLPVATLLSPPSLQHFGVTFPAAVADNVNDEVDAVWVCAGNCAFS
jgi:alcohol dehydrogenase YqhD (iron-dependent ADH family)